MLMVVRLFVLLKIEFDAVLRRAAAGCRNGLAPGSVPEFVWSSENLILHSSCPNQKEDQSRNVYKRRR